MNRFKTGKDEFLQASAFALGANSYDKHWFCYWLVIVSRNSFFVFNLSIYRVYPLL